jgi:FOG: FHA domain
MGKLVVSLDNVVIKEFQITKERTTLGRRPYNDIVIDNLAVSGEHAVLQMVGAGCVHRRPEQHQRHLHQRQGRQEAAARHNDTVEVGKYKIKFMVETAPTMKRR